MRAMAMESLRFEFCAPMTGGGSSEHTWKALIALAEAMEKDNETRKQVREQACRP